MYFSKCKISMLYVCLLVLQLQTSWTFAKAIDHDLMSLPDDLLAQTIFPNLAYPYKNILELKRVNKKFKNLLTNDDYLRWLRKNNPYTVTLKSQEILFIEEVIRERKIPDIRTFSSPQGFDYFLTHASSLNSVDLLLWREESQLASQENREPYYLTDLKKIMRQKIAGFIALKEKHLGNSREELANHALCLLSMMHALVYIPWEAAGTAAVSLARKVEDDPENSMAKIAREASWGSAWHGASHASWVAIREVSLWMFGVGEDAARELIVDTVEKLFLHTYRNVFELATHQDPTYLGRLSYRSAEKFSLLFYLKNFRYLLDYCYQTIQEKRIAPDKDVFASRQTWQAFKKTHFSTLGAQELEFLSPWLEAIDRVMLRLDSHSFSPFSES